ncbi:MAG: NAD(P)-dependent oxidoreductase [Candidatus Omnitrophica bacterium]|nr:NAD(P)-dependent oxidoreductase [Candidatus Omnitrophota bacterium]
MKILITGGAGYLGAVMVPRLLAAGHQVSVLDNFMYGQSPLLDLCHEPKLEVVRGDARDKKVVERLMKGADAIFPLACLTGAPLCAKDPVGAQTILVDAVKLIADLSSKDQRLIYPTTNSGYGIGEKGKFCTEETPLRPISIYGKLKCDAEKIVLDSGHGITLRLATAFGASPRMRLDLLVNDFVYRAVYDRFIVLFEAHFKRNFIHTRDVAKAFMHSLNNFEAMKNEPYNVGLSDANLSKQELCEEIKKQVPDFYFVEAAVGEDPDKRDYIVSNAKIEKAGFKPDMTLSAGIAELVKAYSIIKRNQYANI